MSDLAKMNVQLSLDIKKFEDGMNKANKQLDKMKKSADKSNKSLFGMNKQISNVAQSLKLMAVGFVSTKLVSGLKDVVNELDTMGKTANKIGTTSEQLSRLQYAAEYAGVSTSTLNMGMQRFTRRVAEAAQGTGEAQDALKNLGIEAVSFNKLPLENKMQLLADKMGNVDDKSERLRLAFKLFDSEGTQIINMLSNGSEELIKYGKEADKTGATITNGLARSAAIANDHLTRMEASMKGLTNEIASNSIVVFNAAAEAMLRWAGVTVIKNLQDAQNELRELTQARQAMVDKNKEGLGIDIDEWKDTNSAIRETTNLIKIFENQQAGLEQSKNVAIPTTKALADEEKKRADALKALNKQLKEQQAIQAKAAADLVSRNSAYINMYDSIFTAEKAVADLQGKVNFLDKEFENGNFTLKQYMEGLDNISKGFAAVADSPGLDGLMEQMKELNEAVGSKLENAFTSTFRAMMDGTLDLKETMVSLIKDILTELARVLVVKQAVAALGFAQGGVFENGNVTAFASGGVVNSPTIFPMSSGVGLMGEAGPEAIMPLQRNARGDLGVSAAPVNVTVINNTSSQVSVNETEEGLDIYIEKIEAALATNISKGTGVLGDSLQNSFRLSR